MSGQAFMLAI